MHPETQQILVRNHIRSLHAEAAANRLAAARRSTQTSPPRSPLAALVAAFLAPIARAGRLTGRSAAN
jgi:hypothetical protein